jgi:1,4-alpha-glucan branching enzyme
VLKGYAQARKVFLSGNFNDWSTNATPMQHTDTGWVSIQKLKPGKYFYKFIVDGQWIVDNATAKEKMMVLEIRILFISITTMSSGLKGYADAKKVILSGSFNNWNEKELQMQRTAGGWLAADVSQRRHLCL